MIKNGTNNTTITNANSTHLFTTSVTVNVSSLVASYAINLTSLTENTTRTSVFTQSTFANKPFSMKATLSTANTTAPSVSAPVATAIETYLTTVSETLSPISASVSSITYFTKMALPATDIPGLLSLTPSATFQSGASATLKSNMTPSKALLTLKGNTMTRMVTASATSNGTYLLSTPIPSLNLNHSTVKTTAITATPTAMVNESLDANSTLTTNVTLLTTVGTLSSAATTTTSATQAIVVTPTAEVNATSDVNSTLTTNIAKTSRTMTTTIVNATSSGIELTASKTSPPGNSTDVESTSSIMATLTTNATKSTQSIFVTTPTTLNGTRSVAMTTSNKTYLFVNRTVATINITYSFVLPTTASFVVATPSAIVTGSSSVQIEKLYSTVFTTELAPQQTYSLSETMPSHVSLSKTSTQGLTVATFATSMSAQQPNSTISFAVPSSTLLPSSVPSTSAPIRNKTYVIEMRGECEENFQKCQFAERLEKEVFAVVNVSTAKIVTNEISNCKSGVLKVTLSVLNVVNTRIESSFQNISFNFQSHDFRAMSSPERVGFHTTGIKCDVSFKLTLEGDCDLVKKDKSSEKDFIYEFKSQVSDSLGIEQNKINVEDIICGSVVVTFTVEDGKRTNITKQLEKLVEEENLEVNYKGNSFAAKSVEVVEPGKPTKRPQVKTENKLAFILYVTFGALMGVIFLFGVLVLVVRCHRDRVVRGFTLNPEADLELRGFTAIPRASYYQVDYYGGPQEIDASRGDADVDEFEGDTVPITRINGPPRADTNGKANKRNTSVVSRDDAVNEAEKNQDEFAMGHLPKWDLPKLGKNEVAVSPKENNMTVGTTFGSKENLVNGDDKESTEDASHSYVNPALNISEIETSPPDEARQVTASDTLHAYDNPVLSVSELESDPGNTTAD